VLHQIWQHCYEVQCHVPFLTTETQSTAIVPWAQQWTILEDIVPTNPHLRPHCQNRLATLPRRTPVTIQQPTTTVLHHYAGHHVFYTHNNNNKLHKPTPPVKNWGILSLQKFYCPHALADGNQHIRIREKTLEFSSAVLSTLSLCLHAHQWRKQKCILLSMMQHRLNDSWKFALQLHIMQMVRQTEHQHHSNSLISDWAGTRKHSLTHVCLCS